MPRPRKPVLPFRYFHSSPEVIRLVVLMYVRFSLFLRNVEDLLLERGIDICDLWTRPSSASGKVELAIGRLQPSVRPICAAWGCWPVWEFADWIHITRACARHDGRSWFSSPVLRLLPHTLLRSTTLPTTSQPRYQAITAGAR